MIMADTQTPQNPASDSPEQTFEELWNLFMYEHEPDLMTGIVDGLDEVYKGETAEERKERFERYAKALELFEARFNQFLDLAKGTMMLYRKGVIAEAKSKADVHEASQLDALEKNFDDT